eukprot:4771241-Alexandrium_andersonii.AAC.1
MATYGTSAAPVAKRALAVLRTCIAGAIDGRAAAHRDPTMLCLMADKRSVEPASHIMVTRIAALRRAWYVDER